MFDIIEPGEFANPEGRYVCVDTIGMDYESAVDATPRWYGVSFGNGNDGVSHMWPGFYLKTCEPYVLAVAAMLSHFKAGEGIAWAVENLNVDGEPEYGISATLFNPPDDREDYDRELEAAHEAVTDAENELADLAGSDDEEAREQAEENLEAAQNALTELEDADPVAWSDTNGAWMICEVFQVDEPDYSRLVYDSLRETFSTDLIEIARGI